LFCLKIESICIVFLGQGKDHVESKILTLYQSAANACKKDKLNYLVFKDLDPGNVIRLHCCYCRIFFQAFTAGELLQPFIELPQQESRAPSHFLIKDPDPGFTLLLLSVFIPDVYNSTF
jgi:hypothetical protein